MLGPGASIGSGQIGVGVALGGGDVGVGVGGGRVALGEGSLEATAGNQSSLSVLSGSGVAAAGMTVRVREGCAVADADEDADVDMDDGIKDGVGVTKTRAGDGCLAAGEAGARVPGAVWQEVPAASRARSTHATALRERRRVHRPAARAASWRTESTSTLFMGPIVTQLARWGKRTCAAVAVAGIELSPGAGIRATLDFFTLPTARTAGHPLQALPPRPARRGNRPRSPDS